MPATEKLSKMGIPDDHVKLRGNYNSNQDLSAKPEAQRESALGPRRLSYHEVQRLQEAENQSVDVHGLDDPVAIARRYQK